MLGFLRAAVAGLRAQQRQIEVISNNLSNLNTPGFRRSRAEFEDFLYQAVQPVAQQPMTARQVGTGVGVGAVTVQFGQGALQQTDKPLDLAIEGDGFFQVQLPNGQPAYTRDGQFLADADGRVVTGDGLAVMPGIVIPADAERVHIQSDGAVLVKLPGSEELQPIGQLELATFANPSGLLAIGQNRFAATDAAGPAKVGAPGGQGVGSIVAGAIERANVEFGDEMTNLVLAQRAYGFSASVFQTIDEMLGQAANLRR